MVGHTLITGVNGFIGSHLLELLIKERQHNDKILCLVRSTADLSNITEFLKAPDVGVVVGDVTKPDTLPNAVSGARYIFHLAAALKIPSDQRYFEVNTKGTENMLRAAVEHAAESLDRFILVSSLSASGPSPGQHQIDEEHTCKPVGAYGQSKLQAERIAAGYMDKLPITIVRPSAVYGPRERDLNQTIPAVENRLHPKIGFGKKYASFIIAEDLVKGMLAASRSEKAIGQTYFLTNREYYTDIQVVKTMAKAMGKPIGLILPVPKVALIAASLLSTVKYWFLRGRPAMALNMVKNITQKYWLCSPAKAKRDFGWQDEISLLEGMRRTLQSYRERRQTLRMMPDERRSLILAKYFFLTLILGTIVEVQSLVAGVFDYRPWWTILVILVVIWGGILGFVAKVSRRFDAKVQFLIGFLVTYGVTYLDFRFTHMKQLPDGKLLGISDVYWITAILAASAGVLIVIANALMRAFYQRKLRIG